MIYMIDTREERNILIEEVYPKLQSYCKQNYGLEFQVISENFDSN